MMITLTGVAVRGKTTHSKPAQRMTPGQKTSAVTTDELHLARRSGPGSRIR